jgi:hypothetical protein
MIFFLHENMEKMRMTNASTIIPNQAAGQPVDPVVNID